MLILVLSIIALGLIVALFAHFGSRGQQDTPITTAPTCSTCNGTDTKCEQECMMEAATKPVEYFDDEELDAFAGRQSDAYTDDEVEQFATVLYTMRPEEVAAWCRSLNLRGISIPNQLKDEVTMIVDDGR